WILGRLGKRQRGGEDDVIGPARRAVGFELLVAGPRSVGEDERLARAGGGFVEVAHASVAGAQAVGVHGVVQRVVLVTVGEGGLGVVAAVQSFGRRHHPRRQGRGVGQQRNIGVAGSGQRQGPFVAAPVVRDLGPLTR